MGDMLAILHEYTYAMRITIRDKVVGIINLNTGKIYACR